MGEYPSFHVTPSLNPFRRRNSLFSGKPENRAGEGNLRYDYSLGTGSKPFAVLSKALPIGEPNKGIISIS